MNELFLRGKIIGLPEMLDGRETRAYVQREILKQCQESGGVGLVCFTLNAPGPIKVNFLMDVAFYTGINLIEEALKERTGNAKKFVLEHEYGHEAYFPIKDCEILEIKKLLTNIEETNPLGRIFDIDVLRPDGTKVSRQEIGRSERTCLVCGGPVSECAPKRTHSVKELQERTWGMVYESLGGSFTPTVISRLAHMAMSLEVATTPKPGLVDYENNGAHDDMTPETFEESASAICKYFGDCYAVGSAMTSKNIGIDNGAGGDEISGKIFEAIRALGLEAEKSMYEATGGVNTHAGLIFSLGIISAAAGESNASSEDTSSLFARATEIARGAAADGKNYGARLEAISGFKTLTKVAQPTLKKAISAGLDINAAGVLTLLKIIASLDDTNMVRRGGEAAAAEARTKAAKVAEEFEMALDSNYPPEMMKACYTLFIDKVSALDKDFIEKRLSPGGAADILAIAYFLYLMEEITL